jgi:hypothetical protein
MKKFHPVSYSEQAREMAAKYYGEVLQYEDFTENAAVSFINSSYRAPIVRYRAAKKFGKMCRKAAKKG